MDRPVYVSVFCPKSRLMCASTTDKLGHSSFRPKVLVPCASSLCLTIAAQAGIPTASV